ncbi:MAG: DUF86 domain-containing protein, partial [Nanohaloarchaea archaeon QH_8_44_6]
MKAEIEDKLERLQKRVELLEEKSDTSIQELEDDHMLRAALERSFQMSLEIVLDICSMIISNEELEKPETYKEMIEILGEEEILEEEFADRFKGAAGFRNILVHQYADLEIEKLHKHLTEDL